MSVKTSTSNSGKKVFTHTLNGKIQGRTSNGSRSQSGEKKLIKSEIKTAKDVKTQNNGNEIENSQLLKESGTENKNTRAKSSGRFSHNSYYDNNNGNNKVTQETSTGEQISKLCNHPSKGNYLDRRHHQTIEKIKKLREEREKQELKEMQNKPKISKNSKAIIDKLLHSNKEDNNNVIVGRRNVLQNNDKIKENTLSHSKPKQNLSNPIYNNLFRSLNEQIENRDNLQEGFDLSRISRDRNVKLSNFINQVKTKNQTVY